jgi:hypothetical protein
MQTSLLLDASQFDQNQKLDFGFKKTAVVSGVTALILVEIPIVYSYGSYALTFTKGISLDLTLISSAMSALSAAKEFGKAALAVRDFNQVADIVAKLNEQLLHLQDALLRHQGDLLRLQQEQFEAESKLRYMEKRLAEQGRYQLVEITSGKFAYQSIVVTEKDEVLIPDRREPLHYVCQGCFDKGIKTVLQKTETSWGAFYWVCNSCKAELMTGEYR